MDIAARITLRGAPGVFSDRTAIITRHRDSDSTFDADDFAAQLVALAHGSERVKSNETCGARLSLTS
ncbi:MAG: hypothetical protein L0H20_14165, partial [Corynebacterium sp.]|uniref:hypothetical protein n=1 Tax=Corynebacterium sp. TaxID=1720 RepID=UPI0026490E61